MKINFLRVKTVVLRYFYANRREVSMYFDYFYWPVLDMLLFGYLGTWLSSAQTGNLTSSLIISLVLWSLTYRTSLDIAKNMAQELWDENLVNFFATPLSVVEWILGLMGSGIISLFITLPYCALIAKLFFNQNIFAVGPSIFIFVFLLVMCGWVLGFLAASFLIYYGQKIETVVWAIPWLITPFSSVYYPVDVLPTPMQYISRALPTTYAFEGIRLLVNTGKIPYQHIGISLLLNIVYLTFALLFFMYMFKKSKNNGLSPT
jgi:ABC-2 type transport system permease protein